jgi:hypothetical protein
MTDLAILCDLFVLRLNNIGLRRSRSRHNPEITHLLPSRGELIALGISPVCDISARRQMVGS